MLSAPKWQTLEDSKSRHGNPIYIFTEVETKVQHHLNSDNSFPSHKEAHPELNIAIEGRTLLFCSEPTYLGIKLDRSLTYCQHLESLSKQLTARVELFR